MNSFIYSLVNNFSLITNIIFGNDKCIVCNKFCFYSICESCKSNITANYISYFKVDQTNFYHFDKLYFNDVYSVSNYSNLLPLIREYKFNNKIYLSLFLSSLVRNLVNKYSLEFDLIVNVPNHDFFQYTFYLSLNLSRIYKKPLFNIISLSDNYQKQHFIENKTERIRNVKNKYKIKNLNKANKILNKLCLKLNKDKLNILLVDDIIKTGATVNEISKLIRNNFKLINNIIVVSLAKA
jgi:predicted amidophosphoribosyltransferase